MSYAKAMKHWRNPRKFKLTASRIRGNLGVYRTPDEIEKIDTESLARKLKGKQQ